MKTSVELATILVCLVTPGIFKSNVPAKVVDQGQADMHLDKMVDYNDIIVKVVITWSEYNFFVVIPILPVPRAEDSSKKEQEELVGGVQEEEGDDLCCLCKKTKHVWGTGLKGIIKISKAKNLKLELELWKCWWKIQEIKDLKIEEPVASHCVFLIGGQSGWLKDKLAKRRALLIQ